MFQKVIEIGKNIYANYFEIASFVCASAIILLALLMDYLLNLHACPLCILTRYIFGIIALIYLQNLSPEEIALLPMGCDLPLELQIQYFGLFGGLANAFKGGPTCAEETWRFIFNFAEWGLVFFVVFCVLAIAKLKIR